MVLFEDGLFEFLTSDALVKSLLGTNRGDGTKGIFSTLAPEDVTLPYIVYKQVGQTPNVVFEGVNRLQESRYRFGCYGSPYKSAKQLARAVTFALNGYAGTWTNGIEIQSATMEFVGDDEEDIPRGTIFASHVDIHFWWVDPS